MIKKIKKIIFPIAKLAFNTYHLKQRSYTYEGIEVAISSDVFPPHFTISTKILLDFLKPMDLENKTFLELGCGSGIIALFAASKGADVHATDINKIALEALQEAAIKNELKLTVLYSDVFEALENKDFDYIIINPPYYPKKPKNVKEQAWFCGENFEYFEKLFSQLQTHLAPNTFMILSEDCEIKHIKKIALKNNLTLTCLLKKKVAAEKNYIFNITKA